MTHELVHRESTLTGILNVGEPVITEFRKRHPEREGEWFGKAKVPGERPCMRWSAAGLTAIAEDLAQRGQLEACAPVAPAELPAPVKRDVTMVMVRPIAKNSRYVLAREWPEPLHEPGRDYRCLVRDAELFAPKGKDGKPFVFPARITGPGIAELKGKLPRKRGVW